MEIRLFGNLEVQLSGQPLELPHSKKTRALLGYLAATGRPHSRVHLCDLLFDGPVDPRAALRWSLTKLRGVLDGGGMRRLDAGRNEVTLAPNAANIDLAMMRALEAEGFKSVPEDRLRALATTCRGEFLEGLAMPSCPRFHEWYVGARESASNLRLSLLSALVDRLSASPEEALAFAREQLIIDPFRESAHVTVVQLLGRLGRPREALQQYDSCRRLLAATWDTRPSLAMEHARASLSKLESATLPAEPAPLP